MTLSFRLISTTAAVMAVFAPAVVNASDTGHHQCPLEREAPMQLPTLLGQDAFAAIAEVKELLDADSSTDWSRVDLDRLRRHLVDMNRVMLEAEVDVHNINAGFEASIRGDGNTLAAIQRMIPAHSRMMNGRDGLISETAIVDEGVRLRVIAADGTRAAVDRLRALGFFGFLVAGNHHRAHHLAIASSGRHP